MRLRDRARCTVPLLLAVACTRTTARYETAAESSAAFHADPTFALVAPREAVSLSVQGGKPPYAITFAPGGQLSGADAQISVSRYQAGGSGPVLDIATVSDASGQTLTLRFSVGARLGSQPQSALVAPGGSLVISGTGGKAPYHFAFANGASSNGATLAADGTYRAGASGGADDVITVTDTTGDPTVSAQSHIHVTDAVQLIPGAVSTPLAPGEVVDFRALGGQPPYTFVVSGSGTIDPSGHYTAVATGTDQVTVADADHQSASVTIAIGAAVSLSFASSGVRPGETNTLNVSGGKAPYRFSFATRGNRSNGQVNAVSGAYAAGPNVGATDLLTVSDSLGQVAPALSLAVLPWRVFRYGTTDLVRGDFNGDGHDEVVAFSHGLGAGRSVSVLRYDPVTGPTSTAFNLTGSGDIYDLTALDENGDGHDDLVAVSDKELRVLFGDSQGALSQSQSLFSRTGVFPSTINPGAFAWSTHNGGFDFFFASGTGTVPATCSATRGCILHAVVPTSATTSTPAFFVASASTSATANYAALAAADISGDGFADLLAFETNGSPLYARATSTGAAASTVTLATYAPVEVNGADGRRSITRTLATSGRFYFDWGGSTTANLAGVRWTGTTIAIEPAKASPLSVFPGGIDSLLPAPQAGHFYALARNQTALSDVTDGSNAVVSLSAHTGYSDAIATAAALTPDFDGDGVTDLVLARSLDGSVEFLPGGTARPRLVGLSPNRMFADIDADGLLDVVSLDRTALNRVFAGVSTGFAIVGSQQETLAERVCAMPIETLAPAVEFDCADTSGALTTRHFDASTQTLTAPQSLLATGNGAPLVSSFFQLHAAEFGGSGDGLDFFGELGPGFGSSFAVLERLKSGKASLAYPPPPSGQFQDCVFAPADLDLDGIDDNVQLCAQYSGPASDYTLYQGLASYNSADESLSFDEPFASDQDTVSSYIRPLYVGRHDGRVYFLAQDKSMGEPLLLSIGPAAVSSYMVQTGLDSLDRPQAGIFAEVTGDDFLDLIATDETKKLAIFPGVNATDVAATASFHINAVGTIVAATPDTHAASLLVETGSGIVVLKNDGSGHFAWP